VKLLETQRLLLRPWKESDAEALFAYAHTPNVGPAAGWKPHGSIEETRAILKSFMEEDETWAVVLRSNSQLLGSFGLHRDAMRGSEIKARALGYVLAEEAWGHGYATEAAQRVLSFAFEEFGLELVSVCHFPFNARSRRVIEKCGFRYEGTIRHAYRRYDNTVLDSCCYSIMREEYLALKENAQ
jgi:ribosomal-protein-alanine N-acetyltransferase